MLVSAFSAASSASAAPSFRLLLLIGLFRFLALQARPAGRGAQSTPLTDYWFVVVNLLAGRLIGASIGAAWATQMRSTTIYRVLAALLLTWAARSTRSSGGRRATRRDYGT